MSRYDARAHLIGHFKMQCFCIGSHAGSLKICDRFMTTIRKNTIKNDDTMNYLAASHEVSGLCEQHKLCLIEPIVIINALFLNIFLDDSFIAFFTNCADIVS